MSDPHYLDTPQGRRIAFHRTPGDGPMVVFLGGLQSDMGGTKALFLQSRAEARGRAFLRFDYSGHGQSSGAFEDGCIGDWAEDAMAVLEAVTEGPLLLVGSSMGGWVSLLVSRRIPDRIAGLVTIAAAPDFTEESIWPALSEAQKTGIARDGRIALPSAYGDPLIVTRRLIEDGRRQGVLREPLALPFPTRMLHGTADAEVPMETSLRLLSHAAGPDMRLTLVKGADHRFSTPDCLALITGALEDLLKGDVS